MTSNMRLARYALSSSFLAGGIGIGSWGANLPALAEGAALGEGRLGIVLLCFAVGALFAMTNAPRTIAALGAGRCAAIAVSLFGLGLTTVGWASGFIVAGLIATACGLMFGTLDVSMNDKASQLERAADRPMMSFFHAMFSAGTLVAAVSYGFLLRHGIAPPRVLVMAGCAMTILGAVALLVSREDPRADHDPASASVPLQAVSGLRTFTLGAVAFMIFFVEGAIMDWGALFLVRVIGANESTGAFGYAVFAATMLAGRLLGDQATRRMGPVNLFLAGTGTVVVALGLLLLSSTTSVAFVALGIAGFGMANVIPVIFSAAGRLGAQDGGRSLSRVLSMGYAGILIGPALMGFVAEAVSLRISFLVVAISTAITLSCARTLR